MSDSERNIESSKNRAWNLRQNVENDVDTAMRKGIADAKIRDKVVEFREAIEGRVSRVWEAIVDDLPIE